MLGELDPAHRLAPGHDYARGSGARLPTEFEWELVAAEATASGNLVESARLEPAPLQRDPVEDACDVPRQLFGDVWEWTGSAYEPYPRYRAAEGALGEYNGKFMCSQLVLRGGSCFTPTTSARPTNRNSSRRRRAGRPQGSDSRAGSEADDRSAARTIGSATVA